MDGGADIQVKIGIRGEYIVFRENNMQNNNKITSFTQLIAWQKAHQLVLHVYKFTHTFPQEERYGLSDQMRRCCVSVSSNIAEGFSRQSKKEKIQFYYTSRGSLTELQNQLLIARDVHYIQEEIFNHIAPETVEVHKLINGMIKSMKVRR